MAVVLFHFLANEGKPRPGGKLRLLGFFLWPGYQSECLNTGLTLR